MTTTSDKKDSSGKHGGAKDGLYDCAVIGGGPAGLAAAIYLGRMRRKVAVIDDQEGRSTWYQVNHNYPGFIDGIHARALREVCKTQAEQYGAEFINTCADSVSVEGEDSETRFTVATGVGDIVSRTLIIATGVTDHFPQFDGSDECIGKTIFWCIICDGYETIGKRVVVLGHSDDAASLALQLLVFTDKVTLVAWEEDFDLSEQRQTALRDHGIEVHDCGCHEYVCGKDGQLAAVALENGTLIELDMLFVAQRTEPNTQLAKQLNITLGDSGYIHTDSEQCTNVKGVYAAGDVTKLHSHQVTSAVHEGGMAAAAANYYLYEDWQKD